MISLEDACVAGPSRPAPGDTPEDRALAAFITQLVALTLGVEAREIASTRLRASKPSLGRMMAMYLAHVGCGWALPRVGKAFGRDRTTAAYACHRVEDLRDDPRLDDILDACETCLRMAPRAGGVL